MDGVKKGVVPASLILPKGKHLIRVEAGDVRGQKTVRVIEEDTVEAIVELSTEKLPEIERKSQESGTAEPADDRKHSVSAILNMTFLTFRGLSDDFDYKFAFSGICLNYSYLYKRKYGISVGFGSGDIMNIKRSPKDEDDDTELTLPDYIATGNDTVKIETMKVGHFKIELFWYFDNKKWDFTAGTGFTNKTVTFTTTTDTEIEFKYSSIFFSGAVIYNWKRYFVESRLRLFIREDADNKISASDTDWDFITIGIKF